MAKVSLLRMRTGCNLMPTFEIAFILYILIEIECEKCAQHQKLGQSHPRRIRWRLCVCVRVARKFFCKSVPKFEMIGSNNGPLCNCQFQIKHTHTLFSRGVFKEDTQFQMPNDIMTFSSINFKWYSVFSAGTMLTEREWNANWQSSTKLKIKHSNGAHYLSHTQQWIREAEGCNEQWAYWQCVWNSTFISRQYPFTMEHKKAQYVMRFSRWRTAVVMRLHGFAQCVIIIEANKDHTSVDLCLLCLNARCAKWLMPDNVSQWPLSLSLFCMFVDLIAREPKETPSEGKKERLFIAAAWPELYINIVIPFPWLLIEFCVQLADVRCDVLREWCVFAWDLSIKMPLH